jgi:hypothetical protein
MAQRYEQEYRTILRGQYQKKKIIKKNHLNNHTFKIYNLVLYLLVQHNLI